MQEIDDLSEFSFNELVLFVRDMYSTFKVFFKQCCSSGIEFIAVDELKAKIDDVARELRKRIRKRWRRDVIRRNMKDGVRLPSEVINFPDLTEDNIITMVWLNAETINAIENEGNEEIDITVQDKRYRLNKEGIIVIEDVCEPQEEIVVDQVSTV